MSDGVLAAAWILSTVALVIVLVALLLTYQRAVRFESIIWRMFRAHGFPDEEIRELVNGNAHLEIQGGNQ